MLAVSEKEVLEFVRFTLFERTGISSAFSDAFAELMSSGTLSCQAHASIPSSSQDFSSAINTIVQSHRLTGSNHCVKGAEDLTPSSPLVVDKINSAASLYSESILGHPIALLFKAAPVGLFLTQNVHIDHVFHRTPRTAC